MLIWEVWLGVPLYTYIVRAVEGVYLRAVRGVPGIYYRQGLMVGVPSADIEGVAGDSFNYIYSQGL